MKFHLSYHGELRPTQRDANENQTEPLAQHKHKIRRHFHRQLQQLWSVDRFLSTHTVDPNVSSNYRPIAKPAAAYYGEQTDTGPYIPLSDALAGAWQKFGYNFVPLVRGEWSLLCSLNILFLRRDAPGSGIISAGDIDNRIKTLIDTLRCPKSPNELVGDDRTPRFDEIPMYCLMEDDSQVTHLSVEADTLLDPPTDNEADQRKVNLIITVELRPYYVTSFNLALAGS